MSLSKDVAPLHGDSIAQPAPMLSTFYYKILGTRADRDIKGGLLSAFLRDDDDEPTDDFGTDPVHFSYQKFQQLARSVVGHEGASKWLAKIGGGTYPITRENEWHRALYSTLQSGLTEQADLERPADAAHITFALFPKEQVFQTEGVRVPAVVPDKENESRKKPFVSIDPLNSEERLKNKPQPDITRGVDDKPLEQSPFFGSGEVPHHSEGGEADAGNSSSVEEIKAIPSRTNTRIDVVRLADDAATAAALYARDTLHGISLDNVARYFGVTVDVLTHRDGLTLQGTKEPLRLDQSVFVYQYLRKCNAAHLQLMGQVLADGTGLGKTRASLGLIAEIRWIQINAEHVADHPNQHLNPVNRGTVCPSAHWRGSECACVRGSIRHRWARKLVGGPFLAVPPSVIAEQWEFNVDEYYYRFIDSQGSGHDIGGRGLIEFIDPYAWVKGCFQRAGAEDAMDEAAIIQLISDITGDLFACSKNGQFDNGATAEELDALGDIDIDPKTYDKKVREHLRMRITPRRVPGTAARRRASSKLIIVAEDVLKMAKGKIAQITKISSYINVRDEPENEAPVSALFGIAPTLVLLDESHLYKGNQVIWSRLKNIRQFTEVQRFGSICKPFWLFISATQFSCGLLGTCHLLPYLYSLKDNADNAERRLQELESTHNALLKDARDRPTRSHLRRDIAALSRGVVQNIEPLVIARHEGTPMGAGRRVRAYDGRIHHQRIEIPVDDAALGAVERVGSSWRQHPNRLTGQSLEILFRKSEFLAYYCATLMPGLAIAQEACMALQSPKRYPFTLEAIRKDIKSGVAGLVIGNLGQHSSSRWLQEVMAIIYRAHADKGANGNEPRKHVLMVTAAPSISEHLYAVLKGNAALTPYITVTHLSSKESPRDRGLEGKRLRHAAANSGNKIQLVISTAKLVGTGIDCLSFCSYLIIFGDLLRPADFQQVRGRVGRAGQRYDTRTYSICVQHDIQELVRRSVQRPSVPLNQLGLFTT